MLLSCRSRAVTWWFGGFTGAGVLLYHQSNKIDIVVPQIHFTSIKTWLEWDLRPSAWEQGNAVFTFKQGFFWVATKRWLSLGWWQQIKWQRGEDVKDYLILHLLPFSHQQFAKWHRISITTIFPLWKPTAFNVCQITHFCLLLLI